MADQTNQRFAEAKYGRALEYGRISRSRFGAHATFDNVARELASGWKEFGADSGLSWEDARPAVQDAWKGSQDWKGSKTGESIAQRGGFDSPPTFSEEGGNIPRNRDEPNR